MGNKFTCVSKMRLQIETLLMSLRCNVMFIYAITDKLILLSKFLFRQSSELLTFLGKCLKSRTPPLDPFTITTKWKKIEKAKEWITYRASTYSLLLFIPMRLWRFCHVKMFYIFLLKYLVDIQLWSHLAYFTCDQPIIITYLTVSLYKCFTLFILL